MEFETNYLRVEKTARYLSYGKLSSKTKYFWFVLHGSRMLADQMIYKFEGFNPEEHFIIAPEALNRFYSSGFGGDLVASWMTKRDRLEEIKDFSNYLTNLYNLYLEELPQNCNKIVLAFSQGGTTGFRWLHNSKIELDHLIAYSCWIPEDINLMESETDLDHINKIYTYGKQDQYLVEERISALEEVIKKNNLSLTMEPYNGDHRVSKEQLRQIFNNHLSN